MKTSLLDNLTEEHVAQSNNTKKFSAVVDTNQFKVGPETQRKILINIYNFTTPLTIKVMFPRVIFTSLIHGETPSYKPFQVTVTQHTRWEFMTGIIHQYFFNTFLRISFFQELYQELFHND